MIIDRNFIIDVLPDLPIPLTGDLLANYSKVKPLFENKYQIIDFESIQTEICTCLTLGLNQASIMLTIHLLERFLVHYLVYHEGLDKNFIKKNLDIDEYFEKDVERITKLELVDKIDRAFEKNLITEEQKNQLHYYRKNIRNPYSHSNVQKIFKNSTVEGQIASTSENGFSPGKNKKMKIWKNPMIQGLVQAVFAESIAFTFFESVDSIIRDSGRKILRK